MIRQCGMNKVPFSIKNILIRWNTFSETLDMWLKVLTFVYVFNKNSNQIEFQENLVWNMFDLLMICRLDDTYTRFGKFRHGIENQWTIRYNLIYSIDHNLKTDKNMCLAFSFSTSHRWHSTNYFTSWLLFCK